MLLKLSFHCITNNNHPLAQPYPGIKKFTNWIWSSLHVLYDYYIITIWLVSLYYVCSKEKNINRDEEFSIYYYNMAMSENNNTCSEGLHIYTFGRPFLSHEIFNFIRLFFGTHYCILSLSDPCLREENNF